MILLSINIPVTHLTLDKLFNAQLDPRFELLIEDIKNNFDSNLIISEIFSSENFNENHSMIFQLIKNGASAITTNFDPCVELASKKQLLKTYEFSGQDLTIISDKNALFKPHGSIGKDNTNLIISISSLAKTNRGYINFPKWRKLLQKLFSKKLVIVLGYSGSDDFDINPILLESNPKIIAWDKRR